jgi:hypothetical protein
LETRSPPATRRSFARLRPRAFGRRAAPDYRWGGCLRSAPGPRHSAFARTQAAPSRP